MDTRRLCCLADQCLPTSALCQSIVSGRDCPTPDGGSTIVNIPTRAQVRSFNYAYSSSEVATDPDGSVTFERYESYSGTGVLGALLGRSSIPDIRASARQIFNLDDYAYIRESSDQHFPTQVLQYIFTAWTPTGDSIEPGAGASRLANNLGVEFSATEFPFTTACQDSGPDEPFFQATVRTTAGGTVSTYHRIQGSPVTGFRETIASFSVSYSTRRYVPFFEDGTDGAIDCGGEEIPQPGFDPSNFVGMGNRHNNGGCCG